MSANENISRNDRAGIISHPLFDHSALLKTKPIEELYTAIVRAIMLRDIGRVFTGPPRIGKTDALDRVKAMLQQTYPSLCIYSHDAHNSQVPSIRAFFKHFLSTVGKTNKRGETFDLRERVVSAMASDAHVSGLNLAVLFIDEGSALLLEDFLFLKDIYNDLNRQGVQLVTVMMGQSPDMQHLISDLYAKSRDDLVGRFANRINQFRAFNSLDDIKTIFTGIDTREFPNGSGTSWTAFFLPEAFAGGFKLISQAQPFFEAISGNANGMSSQKVGFPAHATFLAIRSFMLEASGHDAKDLKLPQGIWIRAVKEAQLGEAMARMNHRGSSSKTKGTGGQS